MSKAFYGTAAVLAIGVGALFSGCSRIPQTMVTGINLRDIDGIPATFHGYYVADGVTNIVNGSMKTNFLAGPTITCAEQSLNFEFVREQSSPHGFELTVSTSNGRDHTAHSQYGIRGRMIFNRDRSDEWLSEPFPHETK